MALESAVLFGAVNKLIEILTKKENSDKPQKVVIVHERDDQVRIRLGRCSSTNQVIQQSNPDKRFVNPLDKDSKIKSISIVPSSNFRVNGMVVITINGVTVFENDAVGDFTDIASFDIPLNPQDTVCKRGKAVEVFIWNGTDSTSVSLTIHVTFGSGDLD